MLLFPYFSPFSPLSPCPKDYSLCLFLHCCPVNKFFSTILLDSVYMCQNMIFIFLFLTHFTLYQFSSVQQLSRVWLFATPWIAARQVSLSITSSQSSLNLTSIELVMPSSHLILCHRLFLLPPIPPSIRVFSNKSTLCMRWPKYWSFSFSIIPSKEIPGLISFRMDWFHYFFIHSSVDGHLGCFHVLAIVNSAAVNNGIQVSFSILVSLGYMPRSGIAG